MKQNNFFKQLIAIAIVLFAFNSALFSQSLSVNVGLNNNNNATVKTTGLGAVLYPSASINYEFSFTKTTPLGLKAGLEYAQIGLPNQKLGLLAQEYYVEESNLVIPVMLNFNLHFKEQDQKWLSFGLGGFASILTKQQGYSISDNSLLSTSENKFGERIQLGLTGECMFHTMLSKNTGVSMGVNFFSTFKEPIKINQDILNYPQSTVGFKFGIFHKFK